jgi:hypothetical protein
MHRARITSRMPKTRTAAQPRAIPATCALVSFSDWPWEAAGSAVAEAEVVEVVEVVVVVDVEVAVVELEVSPAGRLTVAVGVSVADRVFVPVPLTVRSVVGTSSGPVPVVGRTRVATMVECVLASALETPTHMLYAVAVASPAAVLAATHNTQDPMLRKSTH